MPPVPRFEFVFMTLSEAVGRHETWGGTFRNDLRNQGAQLPRRATPARSRCSPGVGGDGFPNYKKPKFHQALSVKCGRRLLRSTDDL